MAAGVIERRFCAVAKLDHRLGRTLMLALRELLERQMREPGGRGDAHSPPRIGQHAGEIGDQPVWIVARQDMHGRKSHDCGSLSCTLLDGRVSSRSKDNSPSRSMAVARTIAGVVLWREQVEQQFFAFGRRLAAGLDRCRPMGRLHSTSSRRTIS